MKIRALTMDDAQGWIGGGDKVFRHYLTEKPQPFWLRAEIKQ